MFKKILILVLIIAALVVGAYLIANQFGSKIDSPQGSAADGVKIEQVDLVNTLTPQERLPKGFPSDVPVETASVTQSFSADYNERNVKQSSLTYLSEKSFDEKYQEYKTFMDRNDYTYKESGPNLTVRALSGKKNNADLVVVVSDKGDKVQVQISYVER